jgi:pimeloyl-ACP methyl ester carboxylesterase
MTSKTQVVRFALAVIAASCGGEPVRGAPHPAAPLARDGAVLTGEWAGNVQLPDQPLAITVAFAGDGTGAIDVPAQGASGLAVSNVAVAGSAVSFEVAQVGARFAGVRDGDAIAGTMTQQGRSFAFSLARRRAAVADAYQPPPAGPSLDAARGAPLLGGWRGTVEQADGPTELSVRLSSRDGSVVGAATLGRGCRTRPVSRVALQAPRVHFELAPAAGPPEYFDGEIAGAKITGTLHRAGIASRVSLTRDLEAGKPYREIEVAIASTGGITLAATLTVPEARRAAPAVVLVTGSGPQDRDECVFGVRPFRQLADHLARHGIASLRYDDRGTASSTGDFAAATAADFADDAAAAVQFLTARSEIDPHRIGVLGHSEGGAIAPMVAARSPAVAFIVLWAGPGLSLPDIVVQQTEDILRAEREPAAKIAREVTLERQVVIALRAAASAQDMAARLRLAVEHALSPDDLRELGDVAGWVAAKVKQTWTPWARWYRDYDPAATLARVTCPVLAVNGSIDTQVAAKPNLGAIRRALVGAGHRDFEVVELPGLNHLFQASKTGAPSEYGTNPPVLDPAILDLTSRWIERHTEIGAPQ